VTLAAFAQPPLPPPFGDPAERLPAPPLPNGKIGIVLQCVTEFLLKAIPVRIFHSHIVSTRVVGGNRDVASEILDGILVRRLLEAAQSAQDLEIDFSDEILNVLLLVHSIVNFAGRRAAER